MLYHALNGVMLCNGITLMWIMKYRLFFELLFVYFKTLEFVLNISVGNLLLLGYNKKNIYIEKKYKKNKQMIIIIIQQ